ncbi:GlxA family transcriptional regulator [Pacificoceanicola onchidii]|uniref:GlxA family transcriptional regulator n=1 Tax=Pacificoceanicola onchidii TaxID=2562685 RepID=UPI0010A548F6|nr:GlxA family transcriptional regulator [Pacificoceanicola onchidii]
MQEWTTSQTETQEVVILLFERFSNHCLANAVEPLRAANEILRREAFRWRFVTLDGAEVSSSSGLPVLPHGRLRDEPGGAFLFVMTSYDVTRLATPGSARALTAAARRFETVVGFDTGAWLLAHAGLLDGRKATIHWNELTGFSEAFPEVEVLPERYVVDGDRMTCGGAMTAFDFALELIRRAHGTALRLEVSAFFLHQSTEAPQGRLFPRAASPLVERALALMSGALEDPLPIDGIAARAGTTQRTLARAFQAELGAAPRVVYKRLRLAAARRYAQQSSYSIAEIALRCGYGNAAAMTRAFVAEYGAPPSAFRGEG